MGTRLRYVYNFVFLDILKPTKNTWLKSCHHLGDSHLVVKFFSFESALPTSLETWVQSSPSGHLELTPVRKRASPLAVTAQT